MNKRLSFRLATLSDLPAILAMRADDVVGTGFKAPQEAIKLKFS